MTWQGMKWDGMEKNNLKKFIFVFSHWKICFLVRRHNTFLKIGVKKYEQRMEINKLCLSQAVLYHQKRKCQYV